MSANKPVCPIPHLRVDSIIGPRSIGWLAQARQRLTKKCRLRWGATAHHSVTVKNYAAVEVEVEIKYDCPAAGYLTYAVFGKSWTPDPALLAETDDDTTSTVFWADLQAPSGPSGKRTERLTSSIRRRRRYQKEWSTSCEGPSRDIEIS